MDFLWNPELKKRAERMQQQYDHGTEVWVQYVWQGGARDLVEFQQGYQQQFVYRKSKAWLPGNASPEEHKEKVKQAMSQVALDESQLPFLYCPFMKTRALNLMKKLDIQGTNAIKDALCYIATGERLPNFRLDDSKRAERDKYLRSVGILDK